MCYERVCENVCVVCKGGRMGMGVGWVGGRADLEKNANNFAEVLVAKKMFGCF